MSMYEMDYGNGGGDDLSSYDIDPGSDSYSDFGYDTDFGDSGDYNDFDSFAAPAQTGAVAPPAAAPKQGILERILGKDLGATFKNNPTMMLMALGFIVVLMYVFFKSGRGGGSGGKKRRRGGRRKKKGILNL